MYNNQLNNLNYRSNNMGCCVFGLVAGIIGGIGFLLYRGFQLLWQIMPWIIKGLYYFIAWPFLAFEYGWNRGGYWRITALVGGVLFGLVMLVSVLTAPPPTPKPSTPITIIITATNIATAPAASVVPTAPAASVVPTAPAATIATTAPAASVVPTAPAATIVATAPAASVVPTAPAATIATTAPAASVVPTAPVDNTQSTMPVNAVAAKVIRVVDGDTIHVSLNNKDITIRMIGIDTPETVDPRKPVQCFGKEASNHAHQLLDGTIVYLEQDISQGDYDKYNRLLSYIWMPDGRLFNQVMITEGYAFEYTYHLPYKYQSQFKDAQRNAQSLQLGLWAPATCNGVHGVVNSTAATATTVAISSTSTSSGNANTAGASAPCLVGQIKGNHRSLIYHLPDGAFYAKTTVDVVCFDSEAAAIAAGYRRSKR